MVEDNQNKQTPATNQTQNQPAEKSVIDQAKEYAERIEKANIESKEILKQNQEIEARMLLGGRSRAGTQETKPETAEEKWRREAKERYKGTGLDPT